MFRTHNCEILTGGQGFKCPFHTDKARVFPSSLKPYFVEYHGAIIWCCLLFQERLHFKQMTFMVYRRTY